MNVIKITLGVCLLNNLLQSRLPPKNLKQKVNLMFELIKKHNHVTRMGLQTTLKWGCGTMERVHRAFMAEYSDLVAWNSKRQEYVLLSAIQEKII